MKILMVCLGNICRSPLAHGIMAKMAKQAGLDWEVDSCGTGNWHIGSPPDKRSIAIANKYNLDISGQCCRVFRPNDFDEHDRIYVMDRSNLGDLLAMAKTDAHRNKVKLLLGDEIVPDPYHDAELFEPVYKMIETGCRNIVEAES